MSVYPIGFFALWKSWITRSTSLLTFIFAPSTANVLLLHSVSFIYQRSHDISAFIISFVQERLLVWSSIWTAVTIQVVSEHKATFTLIRVRGQTPRSGLRLVEASPLRVSVHGQLYKDNSTRVYRQSPEKSNRENALRKSNNIPLNR